MALQLQARALSSSFSGAPSMPLPSPFARINRCSVEPFRSFRRQHLQSVTHFQRTPLSSSRTFVRCAPSTVENSSQEIENEESQPKTSSDIWATAVESVRVFPWAKVGSLFLERFIQQFWLVGKWLLIPVLAVSMLSELSYSLVQDKVLLIPAGMIGGIAFCGIMEETALVLSSSINDSQLPWHLIILGLFFSMIKFVAPYLPVWCRVTLPHFANGGLWQTIRLVNQWRTQHAGRTPVEQN